MANLRLDQNPISVTLRVTYPSSVEEERKIDLDSAFLVNVGRAGNRESSKNSNTTPSLQNALFEGDNLYDQYAIIFPLAGELLMCSTLQGFASINGQDLSGIEHLKPGDVILLGARTADSLPIRVNVTEIIYG
ncbi:hypothetical protein HWV62_11766 [Athelia sp. TMB]|nr:hypothetical protein HWV62_11766 [Athelia sp. TMB]